MPHSPPGRTTYTLQDARSDCLFDLQVLRKQMARNLPAPVAADVAQAEVKVREQILTLDEMIAEEQETAPAEAPQPETPADEPDAPDDEQPEPVLAESVDAADGGAP